MESVRAETLRRELAHALRTGPFSGALHLAIEASGLRLEEIQERLSASGVMVSVTTLSYWRRGRSRPERPESLRAVRLLEEILGLPVEALICQLGPRRPRGRWLTHQAGSIELDNLWADSASIADLLSELDNRGQHELTRLSLHEVYLVGPQRQELGLLVRQVVRANIDKLARSVAIYRTDDTGGAVPRLEAVQGCRIGRVRTNAACGLIAGEVVFDRVLSAGDTAVVEYRITCDATVPTTDYHRGFPTQIQEYVLQVQFDAKALPARCYRYERRVEAAPDQGVREVWIGSTQVAHLVAHDVPPGVVGMRWEWE